MISEPGKDKFIKLQESDSSKTTFYFDDLKKERTVNICFVYQTEVANPKPAFVTVQDYYETSARSDKLFFLKGRQVSETRLEYCKISI